MCETLPLARRAGFYVVVHCGPLGLHATDGINNEMVRMGLRGGANYSHFRILFRRQHATLQCELIFWDFGMVLTGL